MQFIVSNDKLSKQVQLLSGVLSTNNTLPILDFFLFDLSPGKAVITASDLETTVSTEIEVMTEDTGVIAITAKLWSIWSRVLEVLPFRSPSKSTQRHCRLK